MKPSEMPELGEWGQMAAGNEDFMLVAPDAGIEAHVKQVHPRVGGVVTIEPSNPWCWELMVGEVAEAEGRTRGFLYATGIQPTREQARAEATKALRVLFNEMVVAVARAEAPQ